MKYVGFQDGSQRMMGLVGPDDRVAPITDCDTFYGDLDRWTKVAAELGPGRQRLADLHQTPAVPASARVFCVGLNYRAHAAEGGHEVAPFPTLFGRWMGSMSVGGAPVPAIEERLDWEGELAVIVGRQLFGVDEATGLAGVFAYAPFNDISARTYQHHTTQWTLGKNVAGSGPLGLLVSADEVGDPADGLQLVTRLNGEIMQQASTSDMVFNTGRVISYISEIIALQPGDIIATGTPEGVGQARTPPRFMVPGDVVEVEIERVGRIRNPVVPRAAYDARAGRAP